MKKYLLGLLAAVPLLTACSEPTSHAHGVYMLVDTSGTYTQEIDKAARIINFTLAKLQPGDAFAVASINTGSFSEKNIVAKVNFETIPSQANQQKRKFRQTVSDWTKDVNSAPYTDITGGLLQAIEFLNEKELGRKTILIFSDMKEELKTGYVRDIPLQLQGFEIVALNVTKLRSDNIDPREYLDRLEAWEGRVRSGGGEWRVINDLERLEKLI